VVWQINDLHPAFRIGPFRNLKRRWIYSYYCFISRLSARHAHKVIVNVMKNKQRVDKYYKVDSLLFYPGVDQLQTKPLVRSFKAPLVLLSIGVFYPYRNYEVLLRSMVRLREKSVDSCLIIVGATHHSEAYRDEILALARELQVPIEITGEVDDAELNRIILKSDVFLFPNLDQSWGLAVFEAMSSSLPVV